MVSLFCNWRNGSSVVARILVVSQSGYAAASRVCSILVYVAFWPLLIIGYDMRYVFSLVVGYPGKHCSLGDGWVRGRLRHPPV